jgi:hypothetical protein
VPEHEAAKIDGMSDLIITGLAPESVWINFGMFLHDECGMSIHEMKTARADLCAGNEICLSGLTDERASSLRQQAEALGAICR